MAYQQRRGNAYVPEQQRSRQGPIDLQLRSQLRAECQQWSLVIVIVNDTVEFTTMGRIPTMDRTTSMARTTRLAKLAVTERMSTDFLNCQSHFYKCLCQSVDVFLWTFQVQTLSNVVHATGGEDRTPHRTQHTHIFLVARHGAQLFRILRFTQCTCIGSRLDDSSQHVSRVLKSSALAPQSFIHRMPCRNLLCLLERRSTLRDGLGTESAIPCIYPH